MVFTVQVNFKLITAQTRQREVVLPGCVKLPGSVWILLVVFAVFFFFFFL